jgi:cytochrome P450/NADPH-cytochrome P450 reductase
MKDVVSQMVLKFARNGPTAEIAVTDDFTRLTLDSIALCAMDTRFNSFYHEKLHPFVDAMVGFLVESGHRSRRPQVQLALMRMLNSTSQYSFDKDIKFLQQVAMECVEKRRRQPSEKKDLLNAMLNGVDPKTGKKVSLQNVMAGRSLLML